MKLKRWWLRVKCALSGGCEYRADELQFVYTPSYCFTEAKYKVYNECVKCGKPFNGEIPAKAVDKLILQAALREGKQKDGK